MLRFQLAGEGTPWGRGGIKRPLYPRVRWSIPGYPYGLQSRIFVFAAASSDPAEQKRSKLLPDGSVTQQQSLLPLEYPASVSHPVSHCVLCALRTSARAPGCVLCWRNCPHYIEETPSAGRAGVLRRARLRLFRLPVIIVPCSFLIKMKLFPGLQMIRSARVSACRIDVRLHNRVERCRRRSSRPLRGGSAIIL